MLEWSTNSYTVPCEQVLSDSGKEKLPFNRKKPPAERGSGGSRLPGWAEGRDTGEKMWCGREPEMNDNDNDD